MGEKSQALKSLNPCGFSLVLSIQPHGFRKKDYSLELLRGKRIAVVPLGTQDIVWRIGFREAGLEVGKDVEFVDVESGTAAFAALNNADIDGALVFTPFRAQGANDG